MTIKKLIEKEKESLIHNLKNAKACFDVSIEYLEAQGLEDMKNRIKHYQNTIDEIIKKAELF